MLGELKRRADVFNNVQVIGGDGNHLSELLKGRNVKNPVILSLQNSLGTWKGKYIRALEEIESVAQKKGGELIISLLRQEVLASQGVPMYWTLKELMGEPDLERTDFKRGIFRSKTGYKSQWFTPEQRAEIVKIVNGNKVGEVLTPNFWIYHTQY